MFKSIMITALSQPRHTCCMGLGLGTRGWADGRTGDGLLLRLLGYPDSRDSPISLC